MASIFHLLSSLPSIHHHQVQAFHPSSSNPRKCKTQTHSKFPNPVKASGKETNGAVVESPKRRGRKKKPQPSEKPQSGTLEPQNAEPEPEEELEDYDDGVDFPHEDPPLVCCFGAVQKEFVPTVRVHEYPMHPDIYSEWKMLQWKPPEFARALGGPPSNVAVAHVRLGGRAAFMGKVGEDEFGEELVLMMNKERVQTRSVKFDGNFKTGCTYMKVKFEDGKMRMETSKESAEDSLHRSELNLSVLKEVK